MSNQPCRKCGHMDVHIGGYCTVLGCLCEDESARINASASMTPADDKGLVRITIGGSGPAKYDVYDANDVDHAFAAIESRHAEECKRLRTLACPLHHLQIERALFTLNSVVRGDDVLWPENVVDLRNWLKEVFAVLSNEVKP